jgi:hypothetical protein
MLTRRELAALVWYCIIFSAVVAWAAWRDAGRPRGADRGTSIATEAEPAVPVDTQPALHRLIRRVVGP